MAIDPYGSGSGPKWISAVQFCEWRKVNSALVLKFKYIEREIVTNPGVNIPVPNLPLRPRTVKRTKQILGYQFVADAPDVTSPTLFREDIEVNFGRINYLTGKGDQAIASIAYAQKVETITWGGPEITLQIYCASAKFSIEIPLKLPSWTQEAQLSGTIWSWDYT